MCIVYQHSPTFSICDGPIEFTMRIHQGGPVTPGWWRDKCLAPKFGSWVCKGLKYLNTTMYGRQTPSAPSTSKWGITRQLLRYVHAIMQVALSYSPAWERMKHRLTISESCLRGVSVRRQGAKLDREREVDSKESRKNNSQDSGRFYFVTWHWTYLQVIPSGNLTWPWRIHYLQMQFLLDFPAN